MSGPTTSAQLASVRISCMPAVLAAVPNERSMASSTEDCALVISRSTLFEPITARVKRWSA
jgi:hypothetical protein